jgi:hypothetical protein
MREFISVLIFSSLFLFTTFCLFHLFIFLYIFRQLKSCVPLSDIQTSPGVLRLRTAHILALTHSFYKYLFCILFLKFNTLFRRYQPNQLGYTIMAECKCPFRVPGRSARLRAISTNAKFIAEPEPVRCVYEFEDAYNPNQATPLFRNILRVKERAQVAIHVGVPPGNGNVYIKLQVIPFSLCFFIRFLKYISPHSLSSFVIFTLYLSPLPQLSSF